MKRRAKENAFALDLAGMKLTSFTATHTVLHFAFLAKTALVTHQCFIYCRTVLAQCQGFLSNTPSLLRRVGYEWARGWRGHSWDR